MCNFRWHLWVKGSYDSRIHILINELTEISANCRKSIVHVITIINIQFCSEIIQFLFIEIFLLSPFYAAFGNWFYNFTFYQRFQWKKEKLAALLVICWIFNYRILLGTAVLQYPGNIDHILQKKFPLAIFCAMYRWI